MKNKKVIIAGGSGFIGQALVSSFGGDNEIVILGRGVKNSPGNALESLDVGLKQHKLRFVKWNARDVEEGWQKELEGADLVINLTGKSVNCRYHEKEKQEIIESRTLSTKAIGEAIRKTKKPPLAWINAASTTIYRNTYGVANDEFTGEISDLKKDNMPTNFIDRFRRSLNRNIARRKYGKNSPEYRDVDIDFSVKVCQLWEQAFNEQLTPGTRKITLRTAIVIDAGGVMVPLLNLCKFALGGRQGSGGQYMSWVHMEDVARMIDWLFENNKEGIYNCVSPGAVTNKEFMRTLRKVTGHYIGLPATAAMVEVGTWIIGSESELVLKSRRVYPKRALREGFRFKYEELEPAIREVISRLPRKRYHII